MYLGGGGKEKNGAIKPPRYRCHTNTVVPDAERCTGRTCIQDRTDEFIWNLVLDKMRQSNLIAEAVEKELQRDPDSKLKSDLELTERNIAKLRGGLKNLIDKLATCDSETVAELLTRRITESEKQIMQLEAETAELRMRIKTEETKTNGLKFLKIYCERVSRNMEQMLEPTRGVHFFRR